MQKSDKSWQSDVEEGYAEWLQAQSFEGWRIVTLKYPRCSNRTTWEQALKNTFRELDNTFLRGGVLAINQQSGAGKRLRRLVALGGDRSAGEALHAHCLVDGIGRDDRFVTLLQKAWRNNLAAEIRQVKDTHFCEQEAEVYMDKTDGDCRQYTTYMVRKEGDDFRFGVDKVVLTASFLNQSRLDK